MSKKVEDTIIKEIKNGFRYPDPGFYQLKQHFSQYFAVENDQLSFGNGSNEVIDLLIRTFCKESDKVLSSKYAFIAYKLCAQAANVTYVESSVNKETMAIDLNSIASIIDADTKIKLVFLPNPNNPTGTYFSHEMLSAFLTKFKEREDILFILDEAYCEYVTAEDYPRSLELFNQFNNLAIIRTMSKGFGLAGLRMGILIAKKNIISYFDRVRNPFNVNHLAQVAAIEATKDREYLEATKKINSDGLHSIYNRLDKMKIKYWRSQANFVLADFGFDVTDLNQRLLEAGVIFRPLKGYGLNEHLRISVGLNEENEFAMNTLENILMKM
jgi:histidinol-phosphate aminotransferase